MARAWVSLESVPTAEGQLELRQRAADDFLMTIDGRVLMSSAARRSEEALGQLAAEANTTSQTPRLLIAGLGMGHTLRSALDELPAAARIDVAELNPVVLRWCRSALSQSNGAAVDDPRVSVEVADVAEVIRRSGSNTTAGKYDAILLDLYLGPGTRIQASDPFYSLQAIRRMHAALCARGLLGVWSEAPSEPFERNLRKAGFDVDARRIGRGGRRHTVYVARRGV